MNINNEQGLIPASFAYEYIDKQGEVQQTEINLQLKRITFRKTAATAFQEAMKEVETNPEVIAGFLEDYISSWDIYLDDAGKEMFPITKDNIVERPPLFVSSLAETVFKKLFPNPTKAGQSQDGSALAAK